MSQGISGDLMVFYSSLDSDTQNFDQIFVSVTLNNEKFIVGVFYVKQLIKVV